MPRYILFLHEPLPDPNDSDAMEAQRIVDEYSRWATSLGEQDRLVGAEKLTDDGGRVVTPGPEVRQGPHRGPEDVVSGYFVIEANDYDQAVAIAAKCPHLAYGGEIEVREIEPT